MSDTVTQHFVTFLSPGTFVSEETTRRVKSWGVEAACEQAHKIVERHGATPYGFYFTTRSRGPNDLDSREVKRSGTFYLGGRIRTLAQVRADADPKEEILRTNMECNGWERIITNDNSWRHTALFNKGDVLLDWKPCKKREKANAK